MGPNAQQPFDLATQQAQLKIAQDLAMQLIQQGQGEHKTGFMTGEGPLARYVPDIGGIIGRAVNSYQGNKALGDVQKQQGDLATEASRRDSATGEAYFNARMGTPGTEQTGSGGEGATAGVKPDIVKAIRIAMDSGLPKWQETGRNDTKELPSGLDRLKYAKDYDPRTVDALFRDPNATLQPAKKFEVHDNMGISSQGGEFIDSKPVQKFDDVGEVAPGIAGQVSKDTNKATFAPVNVVPASFEKALNDANIKKLEKDTPEYIANQDKIMNIRQIKSDMAALPDKNFGAIAGFRNTLNKITELLAPGNALPETSGIEAVQSQAGKLMLGDVRALAPVTEEDVKIIRSIVGSEGMTKRGLGHVMEVLEAATQRALNRHGKFVEDMQSTLPKNVDKEAFGRMYAPTTSTQPPIPPAGSEMGPRSLRDMSDEELMKLIRSQ